MNNLHPHLKTLIIGFYIGLVSQAATPLLVMVLLYAPFIQVPAIPFVNIISVMLTYFMVALIRQSRYSRRTKIIIALSIAVLAVGGYVTYMAWAFRLAWF